MDNKKSSSIDVLKILTCFIFDIAMILIYFKVFGLFLIVAPVKSTLILLILIIGLVMINAVFVSSHKIYEKMGMAYCTGTIFSTVLYVIASNVLSIFLIPGSTAWYLFWELIILAAFIGTVSVIINFSKGAVEYSAKSEKEEADKTEIMAELLEIQDIIVSKQNEEGVLPCLENFKILKEGIQASTPFGRIYGNSYVSKIENQIKNNLESLKMGFEGELTEKKLAQLQTLIKDTRKLVINRETLNIR